MDAICARRGRSQGSEYRDSVVNQLLSKIDGVAALDNILLIGRYPEGGGRMGWTINQACIHGNQMKTGSGLIEARALLNDVGSSLVRDDQSEGHDR